MPSKRSVLSVVTLIVVSGFAATTAPALAASKERVLYSFHGRSDGWQPNGDLIFDGAGNIYGTTQSGGSKCNSGGTVFELSPLENGKWAKKTLYSFPCNTRDGATPFAGVISDKQGNLYGTTASGGAYWGGIVFELTPVAAGGWSEKILHSFGKGDDGDVPYARLVVDSTGKLYGTTRYGGYGATNCLGRSCGTVFQLKPGRNGQWTEEVLYEFFPDGTDGFWPEAGLTIDEAGNLYGTTTAGGPNNCQDNCGVVFELSPGENGQWSETVIYAFKEAGGYDSQSSLVFDATGNLYGTTAFGGHTHCRDLYHTGCGTVFELIPGANGRWTEKVLRPFQRPRSPAAGVVLDAGGNLYGTTWIGGRYWGGDDSCQESCGGTAFELSPDPNGRWTETTLHSFGNSEARDGNDPSGSLVFDSAGNLYGTTDFGGKGECKDSYGNIVGCGAVFEITP